MRLYSYKGKNYSEKELRQKVGVYVDTMESMVNKAQSGRRGFTPDEEKDFNGLQRKIDVIMAVLGDDSLMDMDFRKDIDAVIAKLNQPSHNLFRPRTGGNADQGRVFDSLGEQLSAIAMAGIPGGTIDPRLIQNAASGLSSGIPSEGGFLLQPEFTTELLRKTYETAVLAPKCRTWEVGDGSDGIEIPFVDETSRATGSRWGGVRVYRAAEAATVEASKPKFGRMEIRLEDLMGLCYATERLLKDATALESYINDAFTEEFAFVVDDEIMRGSGAGQCLGILNADALVTVSKEAGQSAKTIVAENIFKMWSRCWARSRQNSAWYINQDVEPQLHGMSMAVGTGGVPVYMPAGGLSQSPYATLYGRPVIPIEQCETLGTKGDIVLADMSQYLLVKKANLEAAASIHVRFIYNERTFRFILRINGQPKWKSALTPYKGTNTLSPFVCLETRS